MIRKDLIEKELKDDIEKNFDFKPLKLSNKFIDELFDNYYCHEMCENFYDSEPNIDDYINDMAYMYSNCTEEDINNNEERYFTKDYIKEKYNKEYTKEEAKRCFIEREKIFDKYINSERRLTFCNWQEPYSKGIDGMSQKRVDNISKEILNGKIRRLECIGRLFYAIKDNQLKIYYYGRDLISRDYWFIFMRKDNVE